MEAAGAAGGPGERLRAAHPVAGDLRAARRAVRGRSAVPGGHQDRWSTWTPRAGRDGRAHQDLRPSCTGSSQRKRAAPGDDLLSGLVASGELNDEELTGVAVLLLVAGHETTANMIALGTYALLTNPDQLAAMRDDPALVTTRVEELLRYLTIIHLGPIRTALEDVELDGRLDQEGRLRHPAPAGRQPRPRPLPGPRPPRRHPRGHRPPGLRARHPPVPRPATRPHRDAHRLRCAVAPATWPRLGGTT